MDLNADRPVGGLIEHRPSGAPVWRAALGILVVGYGAVLLLHNLGFDVWRVEIAYIPFAVMVFAAIGLLQASTPLGRTIGAVVVLGAGAWTYASAVGSRVDFSVWWPIVLMALGVIFLVRARDPLTPGTSAAAGPSQATAIAFWSGVRRRVTSAAFSRADFVAVMGGVEVDLRPATTAGGHAVIEVFVLMGGIEITVPPDWAVINRAIVVMGGVGDHSTGAQSAANTLEIQGVVVMGGIEIKT